MRQVFVSGLAASVLLAACSTTAPLSSNPASTAPTNKAQTSGESTSAQVTRPSVTQASFNNQPEALSGRVTQKDEKVHIQSESFQTKAAADAIELTLVAEVAPPQVLGKNVQATDVQVQGNYAYVSYDVAGPDYSGGVYIIDIQDPTKPKLVAEMTSPDLDVYALMPQGQRLYLSGASQSEKLTTPALLQALALSEDGSKFTQDLGTIGLPSYAGTDVAVNQDKVYVSSGDKDGGISLIDASTLQSKAFYPFADARSVNTNYTKNGVPQVVAFKGTPGALAVLDAALNPIKRIEMPGTATIQYSQSIMDIQNNLALIGAGDGGAVLMNLDSDKQLAQVKPPKSTTNGATLSGGLAFIANGEDGVSVASSEADGSLRTLGSLSFDEHVSSNTVMFRNHVLYVANGRGGLSILTVKSAPPNPCQGTADNIVANPGFELPNDPLNSYVFVKEVPCWDVVGDEGLAEIDPASVWQTPDGVKSMDLNPNQPGAIAQTLKTVAGKLYKLSFSLAGNYTVAPAQKVVEVVWNGKIIGTKTFDTTGRNGSNMGWQTVTMELPAATGASTVLRFNGRNSGSGGPVIDQIKVQPK